MRIAQLSLLLSCVLLAGCSASSKDTAGLNDHGLDKGWIATPNWEVSTHRDPMTGDEKVILDRNSTDGLGYMEIQCFRGASRVLVNENGSNQPVSQHPMIGGMMKFGNNAPINVRWGTLSGRENVVSLLDVPDLTAANLAGGGSFLSQFLKSDHVFVRVSPPDGDELTFEFSRANLHNALAKNRYYCGFGQVLTGFAQARSATPAARPPAASQAS